MNSPLNTSRMPDPLGSLVRNISGYVTSKDYQKLAALMTTQSVVCICRYNQCRDVCQSLYNGTTWMLNARGIGYVCAFDEQDFIQQCDKYEVEWLVPNTSSNGDRPEKI